MKKILSFFVAGALALGLIGCSGDLHDDVISGLYAEGDFCDKVDNKTVRKQFTMSEGSDTEQKFTFTYSASMNTWGGGNGTLNFKVVRYATGWEKDWGWKKDIPVELSVNDTDWLDLEKRDAANSNPGNIVLKDLADGNSYTLILKYNASEEKVSIKCTGAVTDYPILKAVIVDDKDGSELTAALSKEVILVRTGTAYNSELFLPTKDGKVEYYLTNGYLYWGKDGKMATKKPDTNNYFVGKWTFDEAKPDLKSKIYVNAINFSAPADKPELGTKNELVSDIRPYDTSILAEADVSGTFNNWGSSPLTRVDDTTYTFDFENGAPEVEFAIREKAGSWAVGRWFGGIEKGVDKDRPDGATIAEPIIAAKKGDVATKQTPTYYKGDAGEKGYNLKITGLPYVPHNFRLTATIVNVDTKEISLTVQALEDIPTADFEPPKYDKVYVAGDAPLTWGIGNKDAIAVNIVAEKEECKKYYYTFTAADTSLSFKVALKNSWTDAYSNCKDANGETKTILDAAPVEFSHANAKNALIEGLTKGQKYTMVIDTSSEKPKVSVVSGSDVLFAIGNDDFGKWSWDTPVMMTPAGKGEWKYEFKATKADAEFKFQTQCGGWIDAAQLGANATLTLGGDYIDLVNKGGSTPSIKASLTVGTDYVISVKNTGDKYQVKIAEKQ